MDQNLIRTDLLPGAIPSSILWTIAVFGLVLWGVAHWALRRYGSNRFNLWLRALIGIFPGTVAWWLGLQAASRIVSFQTPWPLLALAVAGGVAIEAVSAFYGHECARVAPRTGRVLVACRMAAVSLMLFMLAQPVRVGEQDRTIHRRVLVLIDDSGSMNFKDNLMSEAERADVAKALGLGSLPEMTRGEMIRDLLEVGGESSPLKQAFAKYSIDVFRYGNALRASDGSEADPKDPKEIAFRSVTDIAGALETALETVPVEEISSILLFTDGRHNGESSIGSVARRLSSYGIKVDAVVVGGTVKPFDLVVESVDCPESVFQEDKVRFTIRVRATQANGREIKLSLDDISDPVFPRAVECPELKGDVKVIVDGDDWSREFRFSDVPDRRGLFRYRVRVAPCAGELTEANNERVVDVAVSDDRTNVLLVDDRPRWEYRYLRNLFYGRDKSVHLQDWIVHPDTIEGLPGPDLPPASASREFGKSAAGGFPVSLEEWLKFDIIILGDIGEEVLTPEVVSNIRTCVEKRGALLVLIAGSEKMPMTIGSSALRELMPIVYEPSARSFRDAPEDEFRLALASAGRGHPVMSLDASAYESEEIWKDTADFRWRLPIDDVKPDAEVLAYARPKQADSKIGYGSEAESFAAALERDPDQAVAAMKTMRENQRKNALIVSSTFGKGHVLMLMTDSMWRLRSKIGDQHHHRFWGQVMRWGAGERLRAGTAHVRLGTDRLVYSAGEEVRIYARILDGSLSGVDGLELQASLRPKNGGSATVIPLKFREGSNGFYESRLPNGFDKPGTYMVELLADAAREPLGANFPADYVSTELIVESARRPVEDVDYTATREFVEVLSGQTGGAVYTASGYISDFLADHPDDGSEGTKDVKDRTELFLWSSPWLFVLIVSLLTAEWIIRKRARLA